MKPKILKVVALMVAILISHSVIHAQTLSDNKKIILRSESELWSKGDLAVADQLYSTDFVCHFVLGPEWKGVPGIKNAVSSHRTSFPDWKEKVEDIIAEGDRVAIRISSSGTQRGEFAGISPTGRRVT